jgi:Fe-S-cluster-containing hydrogenase component 2
MTHFGVTNPLKSRIRISRDDEKQIDSAIYCHQCPNAPCIEACDYEALSKESITGAIHVEEDNCVACRKCIEECPYDVPIMHPSEEYILICDLCSGNPECVNICPENAIQYFNSEV